jgi:hypothetical protein
LEDQQEESYEDEEMELEQVGMETALEVLDEDAVEKLEDLDEDEETLERFDENTEEKIGAGCT